MLIVPGTPWDNSPWDSLGPLSLGQSPWDFSGKSLGPIFGKVPGKSLGLLSKIVLIFPGTFAGTFLIFVKKKKFSLGPLSQRRISLGQTSLGPFPQGSKFSFSLGEFPWDYFPRERCPGTFFPGKMSQGLFFVLKIS